MRWVFYLLLIAGLSSFQTKTFSVLGYLEDISADERYIMYQVPEEWETGEYIFGDLCVMDTKTEDIIRIPGQITIHDEHSYFLNNTCVVLPPVEGCVKIYNLATESFEEKPLLTFEEPGSVLQFSLSADKTKVAILLLDLDQRVPVGPEEDSKAIVILKVVGLQNNQSYTMEIGTYTLGTDIHSAEMFWKDDYLIYNYQNGWHGYQFGEEQPFFIGYIGDCAFHQEKLLFKRNDQLVYYDLINRKPEEFSINNSPFSQHPYSDRFYTVYKYGERNAVLEIPGKKINTYYTINNQHEWVMQEKLYLYQGNTLTIQEVIHPSRDLDKHELVIKKQETLFDEEDKRNDP